MNIQFLLLILFIFPTLGFSQKYTFVEDENGGHYELNESEIDLSASYPDGLWIIYDSVDTDVIRYHFLLKDNMVDGFFSKYIRGNREWKRSYQEWGSYYQDSLWTFLTKPSDTTFKTGTWREVLGGDISPPDKFYPRHYDANGIFRETWFYFNGRIARDVYYKENFGITDLSYYDFDGKLTQKTLNSEQQSITTMYQNDSITSIYITQNGISTHLDLSPRFRDHTMSVYIKKSSDNENIINLDIDENFNSFLRYIRKKNMFIEQDSEDIWKIHYTNKRGKHKIKKIKTF